MRHHRFHYPGNDLIQNCPKFLLNNNCRAEVGIFCSTPGVAVSRVMSRMKSSYLLFSGLPMSAEEAYIAGIKKNHFK